MVTEISISENFLEGYLTRATIEILPPLPCDNFHLPDSGRHVTSVHHGLSQAGAKGEPGYKVVENAHARNAANTIYFAFIHVLNVKFIPLSSIKLMMLKLQAGTSHQLTGAAPEATFGGGENSLN